MKNDGKKEWWRDKGIRLNLIEPTDTGALPKKKYSPPPIKLTQKKTDGKKSGDQTVSK